MGGILSTYRNYGRWSEFLHNAQTHGWSVSSSEARNLTLVLHKAIGNTAKGSSQLHLMELTQAASIARDDDHPDVLFSLLRRNRKGAIKPGMETLGEGFRSHLSDEVPCEGTLRSCDLISQEAEIRLASKRVERAYERSRPYHGLDALRKALGVDEFLVGTLDQIILSFNRFLPALLIGISSWKSILEDKVVNGLGPKPSREFD